MMDRWMHQVVVVVGMISDYDNDDDDLDSFTTATSISMV